VVIEGFSDGTLTEYRSENLEKHPDYQRARQLPAKPHWPWVRLVAIRKGLAIDGALRTGVEWPEEGETESDLHRLSLRSQRRPVGFWQTPFQGGPYESPGSSGRGDRARVARHRWIPRIACRLLNRSSTPACSGNHRSPSGSLGNRSRHSVHRCSSGLENRGGEEDGEDPESSRPDRRQHVGSAGWIAGW
jgi:hypothetical protein